MFCLNVNYHGYYIIQYAMFLLAFFLLEVAIGVFLYVNRGQAEEITRKSLTTVFNDYSTNKTESRALVDEIQHDVSHRSLHRPKFGGPWIHGNRKFIQNSVTVLVSRPLKAFRNIDMYKTRRHRIGEPSF